MNEYSIDKRSKIPYDKQLQLILRSMIAQGVLRKGAPMQGIDDLAAQLKIDADQVLKAYRLLEKEKRIHRDQDTWIISTGNIPKTLFKEHITIYESIIRNTQSVPSIKTLELDPKHKVKGLIAKTLGTSTALYTKRLYFGDDVPFVLMNAYYPEGRFPGFDQELSKNEASYMTLFEKFGLTFSVSHRTMNGINLKKNEAFLLAVAEGTACYLTTLTNVDQHGKVYEYLEVYSISDVMRFTLDQDE